MMNVLYLEDDESLGQTVMIAMGLEEMNVLWARDLKSARDHLRARTFDVHLLDWNLPDGTGIELAKEILEIGVGAKVIFLTAKADEESAVQALKLGAIDYIRKPFGFGELLVRIKRAVDRKMENEDLLNYEGLALDLNSRDLSYAGVSLHLSPRESLVLENLMEKAGESVSRDLLLERAGFDTEVGDRSIDSHLSHLRSKLKKLGVKNLEIKSAYGEGYVLRKK